MVAGGFTVVPDDGTTHFGLVTNNDPPICTQGYEGTDKRDPSNVDKRDPELQGRLHAAPRQRLRRPRGRQSPASDVGSPLRLAPALDR